MRNGMKWHHNEYLCPLCKDEKSKEDHSFVCGAYATIRMYCPNCDEKYEIEFELMYPRLILDKTNTNKKVDEPKEMRNYRPPDKECF